MIFNLYSIKDELSGYGAPVPIETEEESKRYFRLQQETSPMIKNNPGDFSIWHVGTFESDTGEITATVPNLVERGLIKNGE